MRGGYGGYAPHAIDEEFKVNEGCVKEIQAALRQPWLPVRQCPRCGSFDVHRHRSRFFKRLMLALILACRYSCLNCNSLYCGYLFSKRKGR